MSFRPLTSVLPSLTSFRPSVRPSVLGEDGHSEDKEGGKRKEGEKRGRGEEEEEEGQGKENNWGRKEGGKERGGRQAGINKVKDGGK